MAHPLSTRFSEALVLAADIHRQQCRKGTQVPYIAHVIGVASLALEYGADEDEAIAALLHDAIEDAPAALGASAVRAWIKLKFGEQVLMIVEGCTDTDEIETTLEASQRAIRRSHRTRAPIRDARLSRGQTPQRPGTPARLSSRQREPAGPLQSRSRTGWHSGLLSRTRYGLQASP